MDRDFGKDIEKLYESLEGSLEISPLEGTLEKGHLSLAVLRKYSR